MYFFEDVFYQLCEIKYAEHVFVTRQVKLRFSNKKVKIVFSNFLIVHYVDYLATSLLKHVRAYKHLYFMNKVTLSSTKLLIVLELYFIRLKTKQSSHHGNAVVSLPSAILFGMVGMLDLSSVDQARF